MLLNDLLQTEFVDDRQAWLGALGLQDSPNMNAASDALRSTLRTIRVRFSCVFLILGAGRIPADSAEVRALAVTSLSGKEFTIYIKNAGSTGTVPTHGLRVSIPTFDASRRRTATM